MSLAAFLILLGLLTIFFNNKLEQQRNPNQNPSRFLGADGQWQLVLQQNRAGHYIATGSINGSPVTLLLDTGASDVVVPEKLAQTLGLRRGMPVIYQTANGQVRGYRTIIEQLSLGPLKLNKVQAGINPGMDDEIVLLGMSALKQLRFKQQNRQLTIQPL